jgi:subtilase family serine protease
MAIAVALAPRDPAALARYATDVSTPGTEAFHHYLTVTEFRQRFAPAPSQIAAVQASLRAQGLNPGGVSSNGLLIQVSSTAGQLSRAFSGSFERVRLRSGRIAVANTQAPRLAGSVAGLIQGVIGLDSLAQPRPLLARSARIAADRVLAPQVVAPQVVAPQVVAPQLLGPRLDGPGAGLAAAAVPHVVTGGPQPCAAASGAATTYSAYTADQQAAMYGFGGLYQAGDRGSGTTVAIFELEPNIHSDITAYEACYSGVGATVNYIPEDGGPVGSAPGPGSTDNGIETELDIENVIGLAPAATIDVYQAPNNSIGLIDNYTAMVDNNSVNVISTSWGACEAQSGTGIISEEATLFEQAAAEGKSVFAAAGDSGSDDCGTGKTPSVDDPGSQPYVTSVGGTSTPDGTAASQTVWNDGGSNGAGGGGVSGVAPMPAYQSGAPSSLNVINAHSSGSPCGASLGRYCREVPDVSAEADETHGYVVLWNGSWTAIGGTSGAAPLWAALAALADASSTCAGTPMGFANPVLYAAAAGSYSSDFFDVISGDNSYGGVTGYPAGAGYDMASGLGTPDAASLAASVCSARTAPDVVTVTDPGAQTSAVGTAVSFQIQASDSASGQTLSYSATGLPAGLSISGSSGQITGTPTVAGSGSVTVTARDATGAQGTASFTWTVDAAVASVTGVTGPGTVRTPTTATTTRLSFPREPSLVGQRVRYVATVSAANGRIPPGTVGFADHGRPISGCGSVQLRAGDASCSVRYSSTSGSPHMITARYGGDSVEALGSSISAPLSQFVRRARTRVLAVSARRSAGRVIFSAILRESSGHHGLAGETVSFSIRGHLICRARTSASGRVSCSVTRLVGYLAGLRVRFTGDAGYLGSSGKGR